MTRTLSLKDARYPITSIIIKRSVIFNHISVINYYTFIVPKEAKEQNLQDKEIERKRLIALITEVEINLKKLKEDQESFESHHYNIINFLLALIVSLAFEALAIIPIAFFKFTDGTIKSILWFALWNVIVIISASTTAKDQWRILKSSIAVHRKYKSKKNIKALIEKKTKRLARLRTKEATIVCQEEDLGNEIELLTSDIQNKTNKISLIRTAFLNASIKLSNTNPALEEAMNEELRKDKERDFIEPMLRRRGKLTKGKNK